MYFRASKLFHSLRRGILVGVVLQRQQGMAREIDNEVSCHFRSQLNNGWFYLHAKKKTWGNIIKIFLMQKK